MAIHTNSTLSAQRRFRWSSSRPRSIASCPPDFAVRASRCIIVAMLNTLRGLALLALLSVTASSCAAVPVVNAEGDLKAITADVKLCVSQNAPGAIQLVERNAGPALYEAFTC